MGGDVKHKPSRLWGGAHASEGSARTSSLVGTSSLALRRLKTLSFWVSLQTALLCVSPLLLIACSSLHWNSVDSSLQWSYEKRPEIAGQKDKEKKSHEPAAIPPSPKLTKPKEDKSRQTNEAGQVFWIGGIPDSSYSLGEQRQAKYSSEFEGQVPFRTAKNMSSGVRTNYRQIQFQFTLSKSEAWQVVMEENCFTNVTVVWSAVLQNNSNFPLQAKQSRMELSPPWHKGSELTRKTKNGALTWSLPLPFLRNSSTASTACWNLLPLLIFIISSLWAWYGFSCSTLIQALLEETRMVLAKWKHINTPPRQKWYPAQLC